MDEHAEKLEDVELTEREIAQVKGGVPRPLPDVCVTPATPPGVPIPYPNTTRKK
jgi:hypothetical protein